MDTDKVEYNVLIFLPDQNQDSQKWLRVELEEISGAQYKFAVTERQILSSNVELVFDVPNWAQFAIVTDNIYDFVKAAIESFDAPFSVQGQTSSFSRSQGTIYLARQPQQGDIWTREQQDEDTLFVYIESTINDIVNYRKITDIAQLIVSSDVTRRTFEGFIREEWQYDRQGPRVGYIAENNYHSGVVTEVTIELSKLMITFKELDREYKDTAYRYQYKMATSPAQPSTPTGQGTARTEPPAVRQRREPQEEPEEEPEEEPHAGEIWKNTTTEQAFAYILSTYTEDSALIVHYRFITDIAQLIVGEWVLTSESFRADGWQYDSQGPRVGYEAYIDEEFDANIISRVEVRGNQPIKVYFDGRSTMNDAYLYDYRPPRIDRRGRRARRDLTVDIENESKAQLGVEYTLEEFREKNYPDEKLVFKRFRYDYKTDKWVSKKIVFDEDGKGQKMAEVDCDITPLDGNEWGLLMPVKTKVRTRTGGIVWDKQVNGELYLYCATDLRDWLNSNKFANYGLYIDDQDQTYTQNQKNDQTPRTQLQIVAVQYLNKDERDKLQEEYKKKAQDRKLKADERKRERGNEDEAIEKRRRTAEEAMRKALSKNNEQIISTLKRQLNAAEKEIWETKAQDKSSFNSDEQETYNTILAGAKKRITEFKAKLESQGETAWVKEWQEETNKQERKRKWRISFIKDKVIELEREIFDAESANSSFSKEKKDAVLTGSEKRLQNLLNELKDLGETAWVKEWQEDTNKQARKKEWRINFIKGKVIEEEKKIITRAFNDSLLASLLKELKDLGEEAWVEELDKSRSTRIEEYIGELTSNTTTTTDEERTYLEEEREYDQGYPQESDSDSDDDDPEESIRLAINEIDFIRTRSMMLKF